MSEVSNTEDGLVQMLLNPSKAMSNWFVGLGMLGIFLGVLNLLGEIHPNYRVSWSGVLTFELTNKAFEDLSTAPSFVVSDIVFLAICGLFAALGFKTINAQDGGIGAWAKSIFVNQTWMSLANPELGGWFKTFGAWCLLLGIANYLYFGINSTGWIDPGVYSVTIGLMAFGFALVYAANSPQPEENNS
ncbi:MAG TPA: hypothetical protein HA322_04135 [Candidatus Poseidoniaceae archaeon]|nr:hypothetical protein [Candidatus Poseidoniaceae archaeon]